MCSALQKLDHTPADTALQGKFITVNKYIALDTQLPYKAVTYVMRAGIFLPSAWTTYKKILL